MLTSSVTHYPLLLLLFTSNSLHGVDGILALVDNTAGIVAAMANDKSLVKVKSPSGDLPREIDPHLTPIQTPNLTPLRSCVSQMHLINSNSLITGET